MQISSQLKQKAIQSAKNGDWHQAVEINQQILHDNPEDVASLNRLGVAYLQLKKKTLAKKVFTQALELDKSNTIAKKQLQKIKENSTQDGLEFVNQSFIEEPGKSKVVELHRLAGKKILESLKSGQKCELKPKNRYISVISNGEYVGALPEDLSFRLSKLIATGNSYECKIRTASCRMCLVFIEEIAKSTKNAHISSFPANKNNDDTTEADIKLLLGEDIPLQIVDTDVDVERTIDDIPKESLD